LNTNIDYTALLQGRYEAERLPKDFSPERIVPDFAFNVLNPLGLLYRPVVDEDYMARGGAKPVWPDGKPFAVCLTHDVDLVTMFSFRQDSRKRCAALMNCPSPARKFRELAGWGLDAARAIKRISMLDPLHCYERWLEVEEKVGARSTFFFWPGWKAVSKHHPSDCLYDMEDRVVFDEQRCTVAEMIREIDRRGWEIGLHPSWHSFNDTEEMKRQKAALEMALCKDVVSVRQHYLHYDIRVTPRVQAEAGLKYDSTLGFNDNVGFRFGTCYPWRLWDLGGASSAEADAPATQLPIIEIPLIIQDGALLNPVKGMRLDEDTAFPYVKQITAEVECVGGVLTLLWHPNALANPPWWNLYCRSLEYLKQKIAFFAPVREIAEATNQKGELAT
jgi:peptidoglycan/xylan/chitin deacetylase (PgdA/CDA1 family)